MHDQASDFAVGDRFIIRNPAYKLSEIWLVLSVGDDRITIHKESDLDPRRPISPEHWATLTLRDAQLAYYDIQPRPLLMVETPDELRGRPDLIAIYDDVFTIDQATDLALRGFLASTEHALKELPIGAPIPYDLGVPDADFPDYIDDTAEDPS